MGKVVSIGSAMIGKAKERKPETPEEREERLKRERAEHNEKVKRQYRIRPKGK